MWKPSRSDRRHWLAGAGAGALGSLVVLSACSASTRGGKTEAEDEEEIAPPEDLMREHGVLNRVLLVYDEAVRRIDAGQDFSPDLLRDAATLVRTFIEDYHERLEEDHLFPRFERAGRLMDMTAILRAQHQAGRRLTDQVTQLASLQTLKAAADAAKLKDVLRQFVRMYRPHEAREDTVLFPALRGIVSKAEFAALGEDFEKKEHELFGEGGFERIVERVAAIEQGLGIFDLAAFTPPATASHSATRTNEALLATLKNGGYVLVMRHARSPRQAPDARTANPDNPRLERQLDASGRADATAMGQALRELQVPVGEVLSSPTYRALETVRLAQLPGVQVHVELGDGGQSMKGVTADQGQWLRERAAQPPKTGNTVIVTHMPNIARAFPEWGEVSDGEVVVLDPRRSGRASVSGRIKIEEWPRRE